MGIIVRKVKTTLSFKDEKPEVYKVSQVSYLPVGYDMLVQECSEACGVNPSQTRAVVEALINRMLLMMKMGHAVRLGSFGTFKTQLKVKTVASSDDATVGTIQKKRVQFIPGKGFRDMLSSLEVKVAGDSLNEK